MRAQRSSFTLSIVASSMVLSSLAFAEQKKPSPAAEAARADIAKSLGFVPDFIRAVPEPALPGAWMEMKSLQLNPSTALPSKVKELIGLAVASQVPCTYCIYAHTEAAKQLCNASDDELSEAVGVAAMARHWSTFMNGMLLDESKFRAEIGQLVGNVKRAMASKTPPPAPMALTDAASVYQDVQAQFGFVPEFIKLFPESGVAGAWQELRDFELSPTALSGKEKSLIGLAVASQIPCRFCVIADTEFAKLEGATDAEIREAVAMAGLVRHWSTILNGRQVDLATFKKDFGRIVSGAKKQMQAAK